MVTNLLSELHHLDARLAELESQGFTVFPDYLDRDTTAEIRAHIDGIAGPTDSADARAARHDLRHPIPGAIMARLASNRTTLELASTLIGSRDLRMREQVFVRTDPSPPLISRQRGTSTLPSAAKTSIRNRGRSITRCCTTAVPSRLEGQL